MRLLVGLVYVSLALVVVYLNVSHLEGSARAVVLFGANLLLAAAAGYIIGWLALVGPPVLVAVALLDQWLQTSGHPEIDALARALWAIWLGAVLVVAELGVLLGAFIAQSRRRHRS
jgi:cytochrome c oxidase assembly factor CtaG